MIQEIKDEVLDTNLQPDVEPRYTIRDNAGNVLNDNVKIELKTPVIENGTPLNKATMGNIQGDLYTVDRYTKTVVTDGIEYRMMPTIGNIFPTEWEDVSTGTRDIFRANGITISAPKHNFTNSDGGEATLNKAFDNYVGSSSGSGYKRNASESPLEILIDFDTPTKITKTQISFGIGSTASALISNVYIKGSKNNSEWVTLATYTGSSTNTFTYKTSTLSNPDYYSTYKIEYIFTASGDDPTRIQLEEFQTAEYYSLQPVTVYTHNLSLPLTSYEIGKIVNIEGSSYIDGEGTELTSFENPYLNINNLGAKQINGTIEKGEQYRLVYNGESWDVYPNKRILTGSFVVTNYSGSASFGETLPKIPTVVAIAQPTNSGDYGQIVLNITSVRETGFSVYASLHESSSITTGKCTVYWVAVC